MIPVYKVIMASLPCILQAAAVPSGSGPAESQLSQKIENRFCVPPSNCGSPVGDCLFCCNLEVYPNSATCHSHGAVCDNGSTKWHCDDTTF
ncbi:hypothetical protein SLS62_008448 [Diatrype stigma]|uniref:Uncharacterized protein n=1 Tax=Diatrype stigma TaxID=117547 RepID=A0AAN9UKE0_9PEZI